jgi:branched-chain amino acid transport system substrate-binding protein
MSKSISKNNLKRLCMDPKQQPTPQEPTEPISQPSSPAPQPIAPFNPEGQTTPSAQPGQDISADQSQPVSVTEVEATPTVPSLETSASISADESGPDAQPAPLSIPIYDSTNDAASHAEALGSISSSESAAVDTPISPLSSAEPASNEGSIATDTNASPEPQTSIRPDVPEMPKPEFEPIDSLPAAVPPSSENDASTPPATPMPPDGGDAPHSGRKWIIMILVILLILSAGAVLAMTLLKKDDTKKDAKAPVKVGFLMALTGGSSSMGYGTNKGIQLAKKQLGAENIEIVQADSKCDPKVAPEAIKRLIAQKVVAIIGDGCSSASTAALPAANNAKIPMISPTASSPSLTIPNDYFFRVVPNDNFQGAFMAQAIFDKGSRKVGVFYTNEAYGSSLSKVFKEKFESLGGKVPASVSAESDVIDLKSQMNTLKASNPDAVFFVPNSVVSATAAVKVAREVGITAPIYGADIFYDTTIIKEAGASAEGMTFTSFSTGTKSFNQALLNEYQVTDQLYGAAEAYDAFAAIQKAVKQGATTGEQVAKALSSITFEGVSSKISFDENGEISDKAYKYALLQVKNGAFVVVE